MTIKRKVTGHKYESNNEDVDFSVESDYLNGKVYLGVPHDDSDLESMAEFAEAITKAVDDVKKSCG